MMHTRLPIPADARDDTAAQDAAEQVLAGLLEARTGQHLANRTWRVDAMLKPLLRERDLSGIDALVGQLLHGRDPGLADRILDMLLNQETSFFRDAPVFDAAADAMAAVVQPGRRPRVWSAACSAGQEPLSLAMILAERGIKADIVASDVSDGALARARAGRYSQFEIQRGLSVHRMVRWFVPAEANWAARPELLAQIAFRRVNLVADPAPAGRYDLILCRNVLMYLTPGARARAYATLASALRPGGLLVLGAGETVIGQTDAFVPSRDVRGYYQLA